MNAPKSKRKSPKKNKRKNGLQQMGCEFEGDTNTKITEN